MKIEMVKVTYLVCYWCKVCTMHVVEPEHLKCTRCGRRTDLPAGDTTDS